MILMKEEQAAMNNELRHYGILGMKWGVRRSEDQLARARGKSDKEADKSKKNEMKTASKNRRLLSDADIKQRIERIKLEKQLKDLTQEEISPGKAFVKDVMTQSGRKVVSTVLAGVGLYAVKAGLEGKIDLKEAAAYLAPKPKNK